MMKTLTICMIIALLCTPLYGCGVRGDLTLPKSQQTQSK